jgi:hypothetical protein
MNRDHTFVRPQVTDLLKSFTLPHYLYYLDEEALDKEVFSWSSVKWM